MSTQTLTIIQADGGSETYTIIREETKGVRTMTVDGETVTIDRTEPDDIRQLLIDGETITIDRSKGPAIRTLTVDGETITIDRSDEIDEIEGYVLNLLSFTSASTAVNDKSANDNDAILYSGRGASLDGVGDYATLPDVGSAVKSLTLLAKSATDTTVYATDDAAQTEDASGTIVANDTWQEVTITFTSAISGAIRLGTDGASLFTGELAYVRFYDASSNLLDEAYLNEHTDETANGLNGKALVTRNGNIGSYTGCAAVVQEGGASGTYPTQVLGMDFNRYSAVTPTPVLDSTGDILVASSLSNSANDALGNPIANPRGSKTFNSDGSGYAKVSDDASLDLTGSFAVVCKVRLDSDARQILITKNDGTDGFALQYNELVSAVRFLFQAGSKFANISGTTDIADGQEHVVVFNALALTASPVKADFELWVDGVEETTTWTNNNNIDLSQGLVSNSDLFLCSGTALDTNVQGSLSDVKIYNRSLTAEEIATFN